MRRITAADLVWVATASLTREFPERTGFSPDQIRRRVYELEPDAAGFPDNTIRTHISRHCVANKKPDPGKHRKLYANPDGTYRLYRAGDASHPERKNGKEVPDANRLPAKYHELLAWYRSTAVETAEWSADTDSILALRGVGKEIWRELGDGEKFIRELREDWYGVRGQRPAKTKTSTRKRAG